MQLLRIAFCTCCFVLSTTLPAYADGICPKGKGWCCKPNAVGTIVCKCKMLCDEAVMR